MLPGGEEYAAAALNIHYDDDNYECRNTASIRLKDKCLNRMFLGKKVP